MFVHESGARFKIGDLKPKLADQSSMQVTKFRPVPDQNLNKPDINFTFDTIRP